MKKPLPVLLVSELLKPRYDLKAQTVNNKHNAVVYISSCSISVQLRLPLSNNGMASCPKTKRAQSARIISSYLHINSGSLLLILYLALNMNFVSVEKAKTDSSLITYL